MLLETLLTEPGKTTHRGLRRTLWASRSLRSESIGNTSLSRFVVTADGTCRMETDDTQTAKIGSLADVNDSTDAEGLRVFYYLIQDLRVGAAIFGRS